MRLAESLTRVVDSMRESIHALFVTSWASKVHRLSGSGRGEPSAIMHIGFFACFHGLPLKRSRLRKIAFLFFRLA